jgi:PAS domain S-box-containing protein
MNNRELIMTHYNNKTKLQLIEEIESLKNRIDELEQSELKHNQTEQTIKTKEIKLRNIIEHSTNLFYSHTPDHILTYVSPQTRKFLDCEPEEAKKRWTEFLTENPENEIGFILTNRAIKTGKIQPSYELELVGKKGRKLWVEVNEAPVVEEGQTIAIVGTLTDITDRKLAEEALIESKQMLRDVLNTIPVRVFWKDLDGVYLGCNQLFARDAGRVNPEEVIGDNDDNMGWAEQAELYRSDDRFVIESGQSKINYEEPQTSTGNIYGVLGTYEDITERKKAEEVLLRSEAMFKGIFSQAPVGIELFDSQGNLINANEEALNIFGVKSVEEVKGFKLFEDPNISEEEKIQLRNGLPIDYESEFDFEVVKKFKLYKTSKSGKCFLQVQIVPYNLSDNGERGFVVHVQNITERKLTEEALKGSEERFRRLAENAPDIIYRFRVSPDPGFEFISSAVTKIAGYSPQEYYDDSELGFRIIHPDDRDKLEALYKGIIPEGPHQVRWIRKDGKIIWTEDRTIPIYNEKGEFVAVEGIAREITAQKEAEDALKEAYDIINKSPAIPFLRKNEEGWPVEYVSENVVNLFEYTAEEFMDRKVSYSKIIHPEDLERVENEVTRYSSEEGRDRFSYEPYRIVTKSGNIKWVEDKTYIRRDENKNITHYQGIVEDITTRRLSELAHLESEEKFSKTFNFSPIPMIITEIESGKIVDVNNTFEKLSMYSKQELMGNNIFELNLWANIEHRKDYIKKMKEEKRVSNYEMEIRTRSGDIRESLISGEILIIQGKTYLLTSGIDITERKRIEEALIESKQMLNHVLNTIPVRVFWKDLDGVYLGCDQLFAMDAGRSTPEEVIGDNDDNMGWAEQAELYRSDDRFVIESGQSKINYEEPQTLA